MINSLTPKYTSFKSLLQSKLKGYWRVQSLEKLKSKVHKGDPYAQSLKKHIERNSSFDTPDFIKFKSYQSSTKHRNQNKSLQCDISSNYAKNFFFTQTKKKITHEKEQQENNLLLNIFSNNERELRLYNSLPFFAIQNDKFHPRKFKDVVRESQLLKNNDEYFKQAKLFLKQINNSALKKLLRRELSASKLMKDPLNESNNYEERKSNLLKSIHNYHEGNYYPNTIILLKKKKIINTNNRNELNLAKDIRKRFMKEVVIDNLSNSEFMSKTIITKNRNNNNIRFEDKFDQNTSYKSNSKDIKPSNIQFNRKTIIIKNNNINQNE